MLQAYIDWRTFDVLPIAGGVNDQDPDTLRAFRVVHSLVMEHQARERKRNSKRR